MLKIHDYSGKVYILVNETIVTIWNEYSNNFNDDVANHGNISEWRISRC
jgi:hypothetical protein